MPKYVEIKDKEGQPAGFVMDYENGYKEVHDKNGQPSAYIYDHDKMSESVLENVQNSNSIHTGGGFPTIEDNGLACSVMVHASFWASFIIPFLFLLCGFRFLSAIVSFVVLFLCHFYWTYIANTYYDRLRDPNTPSSGKLKHIIQVTIISVWTVVGLITSSPF